MTLPAPHWADGGFSACGTFPCPQCDTHVRLYGLTTDTPRHEVDARIAEHLSMLCSARGGS